MADTPVLQEKFEVSIRLGENNRQKIAEGTVDFPISDDGNRVITGPALAEVFRDIANTLEKEK